MLSGDMQNDSEFRSNHLKWRPVVRSLYDNDTWRVFRFVTVLLLCTALTSLPRPLLSQASSKSAELTADMQRAQAALKANNQAAAEEQFRAILKLDPANVEAHANLGVMAFFHGDCPAAEKEFHDALRAAPSLTKVQALLGVCEKRLGEPSAQADMASAFAKLQDVTLRTQVGIELADLYYQQGDLGQTASVLYTLSTINPDNVDILFFEQRVYSELASSALDKLALLAPDSARMEQLIAEKLINDGDLKNATIHYRKALEINPKLAGVHFELAESLMEGSPDDPKIQKEASSELETAINVDGDSSKIECELGRITMLQSDLGSASAHYQRAYQLSPGNPLAEMGLADVMRSQNKPEEAAKYLQMAVASDPLNAEAHYKLSQVDKQLHLDEEQKKQLQLYLDIRASKDKIQHLYQQMKPQEAQAGDKVPSDSTP
jgi:tetratricopeptide (TPR) repeat protein